MFPLTFVSTAFMPEELMRGVYTGAQLALSMACAWFATRAFRAYQRSL